ncbi:hypothetical protein [Nonomuraea sp. NPDC049309]|uniref:hypothetical protein n=1 Tax=Nonomuraea sp. NPDC049309 TaxID=3364350 RepID=UPI0037219CA3
MHVGRPAVRALRAAAFTAICTLASAALHVLVGGTAIPPDKLAIAVALIWASAYAVGSRQRGWPTLLTLCGACQYGLHQLFAADEYTASAMLASAQTGHQHSTAPGMLLIHLTVALGSSWWLAQGELALATLLHLAAVGMSAVRGLLVLALAALACLPVIQWPSLTPFWPEAARGIPATMARAVRRRGPPAPQLCG